MADRIASNIKYKACENPACSNTFLYRSNRRSCSKSCRKVLSRLALASDQGVLGAPPKDRDTLDAFDLAVHLGSQYYTIEPSKREEFIRSCIQAVPHSIRLRRALTCPNLVKPDRARRRLFHRQSPESYRGIGEITNSYCRHIFGISVSQYARNPRSFEGVPYIEDLSSFDVPFAYLKKPAKVFDYDTLLSKMRNRPSYIINYTAALLGLTSECGLG